jgi:hypothetical protein
LINGKFLIQELALGQFNLPVALLLLGAVIAARLDRGLVAGAAIAAAVFVKPYALVLLPWLAWTRGWRSVAVFGLVLVAGLLVPVLSYGWNGNLALLLDWYRTVTATTRPNLLGADNISFAAMWTKWLGPGPAADRLALATMAIAVAAGFVNSIVSEEFARYDFVSTRNGRRACWMLFFAASSSAGTATTWSKSASVVSTIASSSRW